MVQVTKNADDTFTCTFTARGQKILKRWGDDHGRTKAAQLEDCIKGFMQNKANDYRGDDGPKMRDKYDALDAATQAQVDALLGNG